MAQRAIDSGPRVVDAVHTILHNARSESGGGGI
jgi:hypothetical protein